MTSKIRERSQVDEAYKWRLEDLYPSVAAWEKDLKRLRRELAAFGRLRATLGRSAGQLAEGLEKLFELTKRFERLHTYAHLLHDQDAADVRGQQLYERITMVGTALETTCAFVEPEILAIGPKRLARLLRTKVLAEYRHFLHNVTRRRRHVLPPPAEALLARAGDLAAAPHKAYQSLSTLNLPFAEVTLADGQTVELSPAVYARYRAVAHRGDRLKVFQAFWGCYQRFRETYAGLLAGTVHRDHFYALARNYRSDLAAALDSVNVPTSIYTNMIKQVRGGLPLLWRALKLRQRLLGTDELGYHDLYASIVPAVEMSYDWRDAKRLLLAALAPLGEAVVRIVQRALEERWTDVCPTRGKRSGAYMSGSAYDVHPYVLLNYNDDYESLSTAAHEYGHAVHSALSNERQKVHDARYPIFVAEVASTTNEHLLRHHLASQETDEDRLLFLLGQQLSSWRQTVFRQCLFAEFELAIHQMIQRGEALTADRLDERYLQLLREYYGDAEGVVRIDPLYAVEWAFIPHFYYNFYMFQYTTSFIASTAIARRISAGEPRARDAYLSMLRAGGSKYPVQLLKMAGVDMTGPEPYREAFKAFEQTLDEVARLSRRMHS